MTKYAASTDVQPIIDAIDGQILVEDLTFGPSPFDLADLVPIEGLRKLAVLRNDVNIHLTAVVCRRWPRPDIGPDAFDSEVFKINAGEQGLDIRQSVETYKSPDEVTLLSLENFEAGFVLDKATELDRVSPSVCADLARQIGHTIPLLA